MGNGSCSRRPTRATATMGQICCKIKSGTRNECGIRQERLEANLAQMRSQRIRFVLKDNPKWSEITRCEFVSLESLRARIFLYAADKGFILPRNPKTLQTDDYLAEILECSEKQIISSQELLKMLARLFP
jgi:hypothetical protein